jgi:hypothetical protein
MKPKHVTAVAVALMATALGTVSLRSQGSTTAQRFEVAIIKFDGPDRIQYLLPGGRAEFQRAFKDMPLPKDARDEEFCLAYAANKLAADGWEPVNLNSTRLLLRRPVR